MSTDTTYEFKGLIVREIYYNENSLYGIYEFLTSSDIPYGQDVNSDILDKLFNSTTKSATVVGTMQKLHAGEEYVFLTQLVEHDKFGMQYKVINVFKEIPKSMDEIKTYLTSIIPPSRADILLQHYPNIIEDLIADSNFEPNYDLLTGIKKATFEKIKTKIMETYVLSDILIFLSPLGVTLKNIKKINAIEPNTTLLKEKLQKNPYYLIGLIPRMTFVKVDKFALKLNPKLLKSEKRIAYAVLYVLKKYGEDEGHTLIKIDYLRKKMKEYIPEAMEEFNLFLEKEKQYTAENNLRTIYVDDTHVGLAVSYMMEKEIYNKIKKISDTQNYFHNVDDNDIITINNYMGLTLSGEQEDVLKSIANNNVILISGKAGVGKSTIIKAILRAYSNYNTKICTLSAKASRRVEEITNFPSQTIHRLLGYNGGHFEHKESNPLDVEILIIDEASMVNTYLFYVLLKALPNRCKLIIVGDHLQLPPIGAGALFFDLLKLNTTTFKNIKLNHIYRQAQMSGIITDANKIRKGIMPLQSLSPQIISGELQDMLYIFRDDVKEIRNKIVQIFLQYVQNGVSIDDIMIIVPRKEKCYNSTREINKIILDKLIPPTDENTIEYYGKTFRVGARVINVINDYEKNIMNGEIGVITNIDGYGGVYSKMKIVVEFKHSKAEFDGEEINGLELGYCLTFHKSQGSQSKIVIVGIDNSHRVLLSSNSIYTAITRASSRCILVGQTGAFIYGVKNTLEQQRITFCSEKILGGNL